MHRQNFENWLLKLTNWSQQTEVHYANQALEVYRSLPEGLFTELRNDPHIKAGALFDGELVNGVPCGMYGMIPKGIVTLVTALNARGQWLLERERDGREQLNQLTKKRRADEDVSAFVSRFNSKYLTAFDENPSQYEPVFWGVMLLNNMGLDANQYAMVTNNARPQSVANVVKAVYLLFGQPKAPGTVEQREDAMVAFKKRDDNCWKCDKPGHRWYECELVVEPAQRRFKPAQFGNAQRRPQQL